MHQRRIFRQRRPTLIIFGINLHERYQINSTTRQKYSTQTTVNYSKKYLPRTPACTEKPSNIGPSRHILQQPHHPILQIILRNLGPAKASRICFSGKLKAQMDSQLQQLDPPFRPKRDHRSTSNLMILLQTFNLPEKKINLIHPATLRVPT